uniref:Uncharacterized protein n=1 Tax=Opuntia streptacantha TaxID=393608 RepID=A0A7C9DI54_OPUST
MGTRFSPPHQYQLSQPKRGRIEVVEAPAGRMMAGDATEKRWPATRRRRLMAVRLGWWNRTEHGRQSRGSRGRLKKEVAAGRTTSVADRARCGWPGWRQAADGRRWRAAKRVGVGREREEEQGK